MSIEQQFIDAINAEQGQGHRLAEYVYADWLDDQGDPRGEAWRVLLEAGKRPIKGTFRKDGEVVEFFYWWYQYGGSDDDRGRLGDILPYAPVGEVAYILALRSQPFHGAMNAAAIAWVRCHRDLEYMTASEAELYRQAESLPVYDGPAHPVPFRKRG